MVNIEDNPLYYAAIGGLIIGIATSFNYALRGSVTGMSGMVYSTVTLDKNEMPKNIATIGGMFLIGGIFFDIFKYQTWNKFTPFGPAADITIYTSQFGYALAGFLVGLGTKLANGCTSGHGLCGLARFSIRSLVAVCTFLTSGMIISTIVYHAGGLGPFTDDSYSPTFSYNHMITANICIVLGVILPLFGYYLRRKSSITPANQNNNNNSQNNGNLFVDQLIVFLVGVIFGAGLLVAGMVRRSNIIRFLSLGADWNPSLMFVLGCGLVVNLIVFTYFLKIRKVPILGEKLFNPINSVIDWKLVFGSVCFGLGWGIGGLCPGPAIMQVPIFTIDIHLIWFPFMFLGQFVANKINQSTTNKCTVAQKSTKNHQIQIINPSGASDIKVRVEKSSNDEQDRIAEILHEHGQGYEHAQKLPPLSIKQKQAREKLLPQNHKRQSDVIIEHIH